MAIFSRRDVQAALNSLIHHFTSEQAASVVGRLNGDASSSIATEWETVVLAAFAKCGHVEHEKKLEGPSRPDLYFRSGESNQLAFVADIRTISDVNAHIKNPYEDFYQAIRGILVKHGHSSAGITVQVGHREVGEYGDRKMCLALPHRGKILPFVKNTLGDFLLNIAKHPDQPSAFQYNEDQINFTVRYNPKEKQFSGGAHIAYNVPYSLARNPLTHAMDEKRRQLSRSLYTGPKGIIICDGGCEALKERSLVNATFGCKEIVGEFLRKHSSIYFVLILRIEEQMQVGRQGAIQIISQFYCKPTAGKAFLSETQIVIGQLLHALPRPEDTPQNAMHWLIGKNKNVGRPLQRYSMNNQTIKISARALTDLLAGRVDRAQFLQENGFVQNSQVNMLEHFFELQFQSGRTLKSAAVQRDLHKDDDWIILEFDGPDPAVSPYQLPH